MCRVNRTHGGNNGVCLIIYYLLELSSASAHVDDGELFSKITWVVCIHAYEGVRVPVLQLVQYLRIDSVEWICLCCCCVVARAVIVDLVSKSVVLA